MKASREKRDIEWLVKWALEKDATGGEAAGAEGATTSGGRLEMMAQLGTTVQVGRYVGSVRDEHPDAAIIARAIGEMYADNRISDLMALVYQHGLRGDRPDWGQEGCGRHVLVRSEKGAAKKRYADQRNARGLIGFRFVFEGLTVEEIEYQMLQYAGWREALIALRDRLNQTMTRFEATGPIAPEEPWDHDEAVIHIDGQAPIPAHRKRLVDAQKV